MADDSLTTEQVLNKVLNEAGDAFKVDADLAVGDTVTAELSGDLAESMDTHLDIIETEAASIDDRLASAVTELGSIDDKLSAAPTVAKDYSGSTSATPNEATEIEFDPASRAIHFRNTDAAKIVSVSFDDGASFVTLAASREIGLDIVRTSIKVKCTEASATYICVVLS